VKNMLDFYEITCEEVMTPRVRIDSVPCTLTVDEAIEKLLTFSHSRILVYNGDTDHMEWVVTLRELLQVKKKGRGNYKLSELSL
jgi:CBS domain containing-hemolysin-like protein